MSSRLCFCRPFLPLCRRHLSTAASSSSPSSSSTVAANLRRIDAFFDAGPTWSLRELERGQVGGGGGGGNRTAGASADAPAPPPRQARFDLDKLADLAHLEIEDAARPQIERDLENVLNMVALVSEAVEANETERSPAPPPAPGIPFVAETPWREDQVTEGDAAEEVLANASHKESGYFVVPNVS